MGRGEKLAPWNDHDDPGGLKHIAIVQAMLEGTRGCVGSGEEEEEEVRP